MSNVSEVNLTCFEYLRTLNDGVTLIEKTNSNASLIKVDSGYFFLGRLVDVHAL